MSDNSETFGGSYDSEYDEIGSSKLEAGNILGRKYRLEERAGRGGMGEVWKAFDTVGERDVALKFVPRDVQRYEQEMRRVKETFQSVEALHHQYICPVYALEEDPVLGYYLVMKWLEGHTLDEIHRHNAKEGGRLPIRHVPKLLERVAEALDYAHKRGVVHRDVKPTNIFVKLEKGEIKEVHLIDFGLASEIRESMTRVSQVQFNTSGTRPYMPPEQWRGRKQDARTDQYSLAVAAYELYAGYLPFTGVDTETLRLAVLQDAPEKIDGVPDSVNAALQKALSKDREDRFPTCVEFINALKGNGTPSPPEPEPEPPKPPAVNVNEEAERIYQRLKAEEEAKLVKEEAERLARERLEKERKAEEDAKWAKEEARERLEKERELARGCAIQFVVVLFLYFLLLMIYLYLW